MSEKGQRFIRWTVSSPDSVPLLVWEDGFTVAYSGISGDTHLLSPLSGAVLSLLKISSHSAESLLLELQEAFSDQDIESALDSIEATLSELASINLISCAQN